MASPLIRLMSNYLMSHYHANLLENCCLLFCISERLQIRCLELEMPLNSTSFGNICTRIGQLLKPL